MAREGLAVMCTSTASTLPPSFLEACLSQYGSTCVQPTCTPPTGPIYTTSSPCDQMAFMGAASPVKSLLSAS